MGRPTRTATALPATDWWTNWRDRHTPTQRPLGIDRLEDRRVLSVTATVLADVLLINGTAADETVSVQVNGTTLELRDASNSVIAIDANPNVDLSDISDGIVVDLGTGSDTFATPHDRRH